MLRRVVLSFVLAALLWPRPAGAEEAEEAGDVQALLRIRQLFSEGSYDQVVTAAQELLAQEPSAVAAAETRQFLGASLVLLGRGEEADEAFEELLTLEPSFRVDQAEFPTEVLNHFETVRLRMEDRLRQIEEQRRRAQQAERRERERRMREEQERLARLAAPRYVAHEVRRRHLVVALLPFGAGQFQNDQTAKGYAFLGTQLGLAAASIVLWLLYATAPEDPDDLDGARQMMAGFEIASYALTGAFAVSVGWGLVDSLVNFRRVSEQWQELDEDEVPPEHRARPE